MSNRMSRHEGKKPKVLITLVILALIVIGGGAGGVLYVNSGTGPVDPENNEPITIEIPAGSSTAAIAGILENEGLIDNINKFKLQSKLKSYDGKYKTGVYTLTKSLSMFEIMDLICSGRSDTMWFTVPEGYDIRRVTEKLAGEGLINAEAFAHELEFGEFDYEFLKDAPAGPDRLEGYLFPETYQIDSNAKEYDIIDRMLKQFDQVFKDEYYQRAAELDMDMNELITLASIIEREAVVSEDRPVISGVFYNRMDVSMPLQSCATVQYILGEQKPVLSIADTQIESPYNTYIIAGLPPGPICSPGLESIEAALYPDDNDYLYFLAKGDGSHVFAETYAQHLRYKAQYID